MCQIEIINIDKTNKMFLECRINNFSELLNVGKQLAKKLRARKDRNYFL